MARVKNELLFRHVEANIGQKANNESNCVIEIHKRTSGTVVSYESRLYLQYHNEVSPRLLFKSKSILKLSYEACAMAWQQYLNNCKYDAQGKLTFIDRNPRRGEVQSGT